MSNWVQPALRARQEAMENEGLLQNRDSVGVTIQRTKESLGQASKPTLPGVFIVLRGNQHIAKNEI